MKNSLNEKEPAGEQMNLFSSAGSRNDLVSLTASLAQDRERMMTDTSGRKLCGLLGKSNPASLFLRTLLDLSPFWSQRVYLKWKSTRYSFLVKVTRKNMLSDQSKALSEESLQQSLKKSNQRDIFSRDSPMERQSFCVFQLVPSTPPTGATVSGLWPTPRVSGQEGYETRAKRKGHEAALSYLESFVDYYFNNSKQQDVNLSALIPTPTTRDYKGARSLEALEKAGRNEKNLLPDYFAQTGKSSQLNPQFVMEMIGFPPTWTVLPFQSGEPKQSKAAETP